MWHALWPERELDQVPIGHVTNGVHVPTWIGVPMRELLDRHLPEGWCQHAADPDVWAAVDAIPAAELWQARCAPAGRAGRVRAPAQRRRPARAAAICAATSMPPPGRLIPRC